MHILRPPIFNTILPQKSPKSLVYRFENIGVIEQGSTDQAIAIKTFNYIMLIAFLAAAIWACLLYFLDQKLAVLFPLLAFFAIPIFFTLSYYTKRFVFVLNLFLGMMLLLPALVQIFHGGFVNAGAVIAWSVIVPMMSLSFRPPWVAKRTFFIFLIIVVITILIEIFVDVPYKRMSDSVILGQFSLNLIGIITICFVPLLGFSNEFMQTRKLLKMKNQEIVDSINYANRIQSAILPSLNQFNNYFSQKGFVFFKPKEIVGGDFYWMHQEGDEFIIACSDCTGHGIPGAFMTFIGISNLNHLVKENGITDPATILERLDRRVMAALRNTKDSLRDGMDICICKINLKKQRMVYASAMQKLYHFDGGIIKRLPADKRSIGGSMRKDSFVNRELNFSKGQALYLATDGYIDQFGGRQLKKLGTKRLIGLLTKHSFYPAHIQKEELEIAFDYWKGELEQIDDVTLIGILF